MSHELSYDTGGDKTSTQKKIASSTSKTTNKAAESLKKQLEEAKKEAEKWKETAERRNEALKKRNETISQLKETAERRNEAIINRNETIKNLKSEIQAKDAKIKDLETQLVNCCKCFPGQIQIKTNIERKIEYTQSQTVVYSEPDEYIPESPPPIPDWTGTYVEPRISVTKTVREFMYGLNEIEISSTRYNKNAVIVTKPIISDIDVREISIEVSETHPIIDNDYNVIPIATSIEYYLIIGGQQFDIMPRNHDKIENELLFFKNSIAKLRFKPDILHPIKVYKDGVMVDDKNIILLDGGESISIVNFDSSSSYTASYYPLINDVYNPKVVKLSKDFIKQRLVYIDEEFDGADYNMKIKLSHTPYIDNELIEQQQFDPNNNLHPVEVYFTESDFKDSKGNIIQNIYQNSNNSIYIKNVTNYKEKMAPRLNVFNPKEYPVIEYYHTRNEIHFNEMFKYSEIYSNMLYGSNGNAKIHVKYQYPKIDVRLKAILRRTSDKYDEYISPRLNEVIVLAKFVK